MKDLILVAILLLIIGGAIAYILKAKKSGVKCIGCPSAKTCSTHSGSCSGHCGCCSGCSSSIDNNDNK